MQKAVTWVFACIAALATVALLCRTWEWDSPHPYRLRIQVASSWDEEAGWYVDGGVGRSPLPGLEANINSRMFIERLKDRLSRHPVVDTWSTRNVQLEPYLLGPGGPLCIDVQAPVYGRRHWSLLSQGHGIDRGRTDELKADVQAALKQLLKEGYAARPFN